MRQHHSVVAVALSAIMRLALSLLIVAAMSVTAQAKIKTQLVEYKQGGAVFEGYLSFDDAIKE